MRVQSRNCAQKCKKYADRSCLSAFRSALGGGYISFLLAEIIQSFLSLQTLFPHFLFEFAVAGLSLILCAGFDKNQVQYMLGILARRGIREISYFPYVPLSIGIALLARNSGFLTSVVHLIQQRLPQNLFRKYSVIYLFRLYHHLGILSFKFHWKCTFSALPPCNAFIKGI